jgi:U3-containing 90S pre-ribosomal complex subunit CMS1-like protein
MASNSIPAPKPKKRKQNDDGTPRKKRKQAGWNDELLDAEAGLNRAFGSMDSQLLADYLSQKTARFGTDLSPVELSDLYISGEVLPLRRHAGFSLMKMTISECHQGHDRV